MGLKSYFLATAFATAFLSGCGGGGSSDPTIAVTSDGVVQGAMANGVISYKGIPFAAPPVDSLRWKAPQPVAAWSGVR